MMRMASTWRRLRSGLLAAVALCAGCNTTTPTHVVGVESIECIWNAAPHSAFTDLLAIDDRLLCTFREGDAHVHGADGVIRIIERGTDGTWHSVARLEETGIDLRDPKLSRTPDGRIMLLCGGSVYVDRTLQSMATRVAFANPEDLQFGPFQPVVIDEAITTDRDWLWRITWHADTGYGVVYQPFEPVPGAHLVSTDDGVHYEHVTQLPIDGSPNEVTLRFDDDGTMAALVRRGSGDQHAMFGQSAPPHVDWTFTPLPERIGGPDFIALGDHWVASGRRYEPDAQRTIVARLDRNGDWTTLEVLPSGGDTSYPGLVIDDDQLLVSYYSSHEGRTSIYLATFALGAGEGP